MRITQGTFSFLPDLTNAEIAAQVQYALDNGWVCAVEHTDDPHPRNTYWEMFGTPMFDVRDAAGVMIEVHACRGMFPCHYVRLNAFDATRGVESVRLSFIVQRPAEEPGFVLTRQDADGRRLRYTTSSHATARPRSERY